MKRAYLDTEFTNLNRYTHKLISLALVVPGGPEFYVELTDNWNESDCSDFVAAVVLPQLDQTIHGLNTKQARVALLAFLQEVGPLEIISDAPQWDWPLLLWLMGPAGLPEGIKAGQIDVDIDAADDSEDSPHHALQDARILAEILEPL